MGQHQFLDCQRLAEQMPMNNEIVFLWAERVKEIAGILRGRFTFGKAPWCRCGVIKCVPESRFFV